jgi:hypothetical protein
MLLLPSSLLEEIIDHNDKKKLIESGEIALVFTLILAMSIPVLIVCLLLVPIRYCFDLRLQKKEMDSFNS